MTAQKIAAIYVRVSTDEQADNDSLPEQRKRCAEYARFRGLLVPSEYIFEEDYTGTEFERPEMDKVRRLIREGKIQALIVKNSGRLTRGGAGHVTRFFGMFRHYNVELHYAERGIVDVSPRGETVGEIEGTFDKAWRNSLVQAMVDGKRYKAERGAIVGIGQPLYGYRKSDDKRNLTFIEEPEQAAVVRDIFDWLVNERLTVNQIQQRLNAREIPPPGYYHEELKRQRAEQREQMGNTKRPFQSHRKQKGWAKHTLYVLIRNEAYAGTYYQNTMVVRKPTEDEIQDFIERGKKVPKKIQKLRPRSEWIATSVTPLVSRDVWEAAQHILDNGKRMAERKHAKQQYLMGRRLRCSCGYTRHGSYLELSKYGKRDQRYYECASRKTASGKCDQPLFRVDQVDTEAWEFTKELLLNPASLWQEWQRQQNENARDTAHIQEEITHLDSLIEQAHARLGRTLDKLDEAEERHDHDEVVHYTARRDEIKATLSQHRAERETLQSKISRATLPEETIRTLAQMGEENRELLQQPDLPFDFKRGLINELDINGVTGIEPDGRKFVVFSFGGHKRRHWLGDKYGSSRSMCSDS
jgi:site-specific DNA recombinase